MKTNHFILLGAYLIANIYLIWRTNTLLKNFKWTKKIVRITIFVVYGLLALLPVCGAFLPESMGLYTFQKYGNIFLGFLLYYSILLILGEIALLIGRKKKETVGKIILCIALFGSLGLNVYGTYHAQDTQLMKIGRASCRERV